MKKIITIQDQESAVVLPVNIGFAYSLEILRILNPSAARKKLQSLLDR